jgi:ubiquitin-conjugating enzyme E2 variant
MASKSSYLDLKDTETRNAKKALLKSGYSNTKRAFEILWFVLAAFLTPMAFLNIIKHAAIFSWPYALIGSIGGILFADFMSGVVHWGADTWGSLDVPLVGGTFIRSFREHHLSPTAMCEHDAIETNGDNIMLTIPVLALLVIKDMLATSPDGVTAAGAEIANSCFWLMACIGVQWTNQFHKWSHMNKLPSVVDFCQRNWIILPKRVHNIHHRPPFDSNYCITTGWLNPFLSVLGFWRFAERSVTLVTGWIPREDDYKWTGLSDGIPDVVAKYIREKQLAKSNGSSKGQKE